MDESGNPSTVQVGRGGVADSPSADDSLGFEPYVTAVARFLTSDVTRPPLTMSIEGEWGTGKSSFLLQLRDQIKRADHTVVEFNAWRHDKEDALWAAFALELVTQLARSSKWQRRILARVVLLFRRFDFGSGWFDLLRVCFLLLLWMVATYSLGGFIVHRGTKPIFDALSWKGGAGAETAKTTRGPSGETKQEKESSEDDSKRILTLILGVGGFGGYMAVLFQLAKNLKSVLGNPLSNDLQKYLRKPDYEGHVAFLENFHRDFAKIVKTYVGDRTLFIFIDDLDRCEVPKAADLIQALNLLVGGDSRQLIFVIAMDREKVAAGLAAKYQALLPYLYPGEEVSDIGLQYGYTFIEKFIQIPFLVPHPTVSDLDRWLNSINGGTAQTSQSSSPPLRKDLVDIVEGQDSTRFREIVKMVAPLLDDNPRRLKQFLNVFRLRTHLASETGLFNSHIREARRTRLTLEQLGKFTAISLRWPRFVTFLASDHNLLRHLQTIASSGVEASEVTEKEIERLLEDEKPSVNLRHWASKPKLLHLLKFGISETNPGDPQYSLEFLDVAKLLQISPRSKPRRQNSKQDDTGMGADDVTQSNIAPEIEEPEEFEPSAVETNFIPEPRFPSKGGPKRKGEQFLK